MRLDADVRRALASAYAPRSSGPLGTALRSLAKFAQRIPNRTLFKQPTVRGELATESHNEWTLMLWAVDLAAEKSAKTGKYLKAKTIEQRLSLAKGFLSFRYGFQIAGEAPRLKHLLKVARDKDPFRTLRKKRRGLRRRHLQKLWSEHGQVRSRDPTALNEWAAVTTAWHVLARGGELERLTMGDLQFKQQRRGGRRYAILWILPLKKRGGAQQKLPQFIYEQESPEEWEPYRALRRLADIRKGAASSAPLFTARNGARMTTARFRALVKRYARMLGWDPKEAGAHSPCIGGATEYAATGKVSQLLLEAKGRWSSDVAAIYARMTRRLHQAASDLMFQAKGRDLEELIPEYVQPA
jgi:hypothetical protein